MLNKLKGMAVREIVRRYWGVAVGIVFGVGSIGLFMGAIACTVASIILMNLNPDPALFDLMIAMMLGFWITFIVMIVLAGVLVVFTGKRK